MRRERGFTLIELLIVVAIIGIIATLAIPNFLEAMERARQKRTIQTIKTMCIAMQTYSVDWTGYPSAAHSGDPRLQWPLIVDSGGTPIVVPDLIQAMPTGDGWGSPLACLMGPDNPDIQPRLNDFVSSHFCIYSIGSDRVPGGGTDGSGAGPALAAAWCQDPPTALGTLEAHCFQSDIVWGDSHFQQSPEGKQKKC
jgi:type II secretion system protein G